MNDRKYVRGPRELAKRPVSRLIGRVFSRLTVKEMVGAFADGSYKCRCLCECGRWVDVHTSNLYSGHTKSCGCLVPDSNRETRQTHGMHEATEYTIWCRMKARCHRPSDEAFPLYGARGITVCRRWRSSFAAFFKDMGPRPAGLTLDRKDNNGNYEPNNCRWATRKQQARNTRRSRWLTYRGETRVQQEWAERLGISTKTISTRLHRGWSVDEALGGLRP